MRNVAIGNMDPASIETSIINKFELILKFLSNDVMIFFCLI